MPAEFGSSFGRVGALVEQKAFGVIVAQACPRLIVGASDRSRRAGCHPAFDRLLPCHHRRCLDRRLLGDGGTFMIDILLS
jgi:hypothetical protein